MPKEIPSSTNLADSTPSPFLLVGFHPSNHLHPTRPVQCFSQALEDRNGGAYMAPEAQGPATCPPAPRAARRGGPAPQQTIPCCSAAHLRSPTLGCSCSAAAGLAAGPWCWGGDTGSPVSQETQAALSHTLQLPWVETGGSRLWLPGSSCLPKPVLLSSGRGEQKSILDVQPQRKRSGYSTIGSSKLQTAPLPLIFPVVTVC